MDITRITITLMIPEPAHSALIELNTKLAGKFATRFLSEFVTYTPHITLYQAEFPSKHADEVLTTLASLAKSTPPILCTPTHVNHKGRYVGIEFTKTPLITEFHELIVRKLNHLREGRIKDAYQGENTTLSPEERANIQVWGYPYVMGQYHPHLTIISLEDNAAAEQVMKEARFDEEFRAHTLRVVSTQTDPQGVTRRVITEYELNVQEPPSIRYAGAFVDNPKELLKLFPPIHSKIYADHSTIVYRPKSLEGINAGEKVKLKIIGRAFDDKGDALLVENPNTSILHPHITLSCSEETKAYYSNELLLEAFRNNTLTYLPEPIYIDATIGYIDASNTTFLEPVSS